MEQLKDARDSVASDHKPPIDPLRRVFVYNGDRFRTHDGVYYCRPTVSDTIYRQIPKARGKAARKHDKAQRRLLKQREAQCPSQS